MFVLWWGCGMWCHFVMKMAFHPSQDQRHQHKVWNQHSPNSQVFNHNFCNISAKDSKVRFRIKWMTRLATQECKASRAQLLLCWMLWRCWKHLDSTQHKAWFSSNQFRQWQGRMWDETLTRKKSELGKGHKGSFTITLLQKKKKWGNCFCQGN